MAFDGNAAKTFCERSITGSSGNMRRTHGDAQMLILASHRTARFAESLGRESWDTMAG
jgi:hypothetical protein